MLVAVRQVVDHRGPDGWLRQPAEPKSLGDVRILIEVHYVRNVGCLNSLRSVVEFFIH